MRTGAFLEYPSQPGTPERFDREVFTLLHSSRVPLGAVLLDDWDSLAAMDAVRGNRVAIQIGYGFHWASER